MSDRPEGTRRIYYINPYGLAGLRQWLDQLWDVALANFQVEIERDIATKETPEP